MNELTKTLIYIGSAAAALTLAVFVRPRSYETPGVQKGDVLFERFDDASRAKTLEIVRYDETADEFSRLKISDKAGRWVIASHNDYPADAKDAEERIRSAAINLMDMEVLGVATELTSEHAKFGVVEPDEKQLKDGHDGVGVLISMRDASGGKLAELIVGKPVRGQQNQRFVRQPSQNVVYAVKFDESKLSTNFKDWIQPDLLTLNQNDIRQVTLKDYSFDQQVIMTPDGRAAGVIPQYEERLEVAANWNPDEWKWKLDRFLENREGRLAESKLLEGEELNTQKLDDLKSALDQLEIINVESKPQGLGAGLEPDEQMLADDKILQSLVVKGFFPVRIGEGKVTLLSSDGEVAVSDKDGVEYVLRFGRISGMEAKDESTKLNRYLLVTARLDSKTLTPPELAPLPGGDEPSAPASDAAPSGEAPKSSSLSRETYFIALQDEDQAAEASGETPAEGAEADAETGDAPAETPPAQPAATPPANAAAPTDGGPTDTERKRIQEENDKKMAEFNEKKKKAEDRVSELNKRFGPWYYVISEDVYRKIHLGRFDLIKEKSAEGSTNVDAFRGLEKEGLKKSPPPTADNPGLSPIEP